MATPGKLKSIRLATVTASDAAGLAAAVNAWIDNNAGQRSFVQVDYWADVALPVGTQFTAFITYTE